MRDDFVDPHFKHTKKDKMVSGADSQSQGADPDHGLACYLGRILRAEMFQPIAARRH